MDCVLSHGPDPGLRGPDLMSLSYPGCLQSRTTDMGLPQARLSGDRDHRAAGVWKTECPLVRALGDQNQKWSRAGKKPLQTDSTSRWD